MFVVFLSYLLSVPAAIVASSAVQHLKATVGGSAYIVCSLPGHPLSVQWFYWQEDKSNNTLYHWNINGGTQSVSDEYKGRVHLLNTEFKSGNISIRLDNVTVGDDNKTFWASVRVSDERTKLFEQMCRSNLQVSAPYRDLNLTVNNTANVATCTARGGYPEPQVSWTGQNRSSGEHLDLHGAEMFPHQDPTEKTFTITSNVSVKDLSPVTCLIYNPRSNQRINKTSEVHADENQPMQHVHTAIVVPVVIAVVFIIITVLCVWRRSARQTH